jgi:methionyl-tRNA formyltransferase
VASVNFEKPIQDIYNLIRGCDPQPGAYTTLERKKVRFYDVELNLSEVERVSGEIVSIEGGGLQIAGKGGILKIGKLRIDKGEKIGPMEFAQTMGIKRGDRLGE